MSLYLLDINQAGAIGKLEHKLIFKDHVDAVFSACDEGSKEKLQETLANLGRRMRQVPFYQYPGKLTLEEVVMLYHLCCQSEKEA